MSTVFLHGTGGVDVSGVTATQLDVRDTKYFVDSDGVQKPGNLQTRTRSSISTTAGSPTVSVPAGIYDISHSVTVTDSDLESVNILSGCNIFGVPGTHPDVVVVSSIIEAYSGDLQPNYVEFPTQYKNAKSARVLQYVIEAQPLSGDSTTSIGLLVYAGVATMIATGSDRRKLNAGTVSSEDFSSSFSYDATTGYITLNVPSTLSHYTFDRGYDHRVECVIAFTY